jgi:hypothetical protein
LPSTSPYSTTRSSTAPTRLVSSPSRYVIAVIRIGFTDPDLDSYEIHNSRVVNSPSRYNIAMIRICKVVASLIRIRIPTRSSTAPTRLVSSPSRYIIAVIRIGFTDPDPDSDEKLNSRVASSSSRYIIAVIRICNVLASLIRICIPTRSSTAPTRLVSSPSRYIIAVIRICNVVASGSSFLRDPKQPQQGLSARQADIL